MTPTGEQIKALIGALEADLVKGMEALRQQVRAARDEKDRKVEQLRSVCPHEYDSTDECKWCGDEL